MIFFKQSLIMFTIVSIAIWFKPVISEDPLTILQGME